MYSDLNANIVVNVSKQQNIVMDVDVDIYQLNNEGRLRSLESVDLTISIGTINNRARAQFIIETRTHNHLLSIKGVFNNLGMLTMTGRSKVNKRQLGGLHASSS